MRYMLAVLITASAFVPVMAGHAAIDSATINITANLVENTCTPQWSDAGLSVDMNRVSLNDFGNERVAAIQNFTLSLDNCGGASRTIKVHATGSSNSFNPSLFSNTAENGATGVAVSLWGGSSQMTKMLPNGGTSVEYTVTEHKVDMVFQVRLIKNYLEKPGVGYFSSVVTMMIDYP